ncbi:CLOCK-interacting pacemaker isoform X2 [Latimeria chalumnae]|uniref:CLOCK-interacting pacemaker isoform X2 n=1 Tax=Latimeria chalumnae TaxID=7897 RepID=UPI0003C184B4|nr:PREDICTED: CLOCK-interacting pacemaker-like [Latimeria chalumnae]|eukprot:XP_005991653.1 PREDICTED: CLOCK-interacting pacemaker-like [Latimeria chalumnae]
MAPTAEESLESTRKYAKEKANSACVKMENAPLENRKRQMEKKASASENTRNPRPCESDSGFSDTSSEHLSNAEQADLPDIKIDWSSVSSRLDELQRVYGPFTGLTPVYIVKNVLFKQWNQANAGLDMEYLPQSLLPFTVQTNNQILHTQLAWGGQHALSAASGQPRVLFIQQPVAASTLKSPVSNKRKERDTYLPILNSYPKIAPHPDKSRDNQANGQTSENHGILRTDRTAGRSKNKRFCVEDTRVSSSESAMPKNNEVPSAAPERQEQPSPPTASIQQASNAAFKLDRFVQSEGYRACSSPHLGVPLSQSPAFSSAELSPSSAALEFPVGMLPSGTGDRKGANKGSKKHAPGIVKQKRFHNTVEILSKSGLLGITLKTKGLIRQNRNTQREIDELKEHTRLLCKAMQSNDSQAWLKLQEAMNVSGSYKGLNGRTGRRSASSTAPVTALDLSMKSMLEPSANLTIIPGVSAHA